MKDVKDSSFSCDFKPNKEEKEQTRLTAGGDRFNYLNDCGTPTADMTLFKILINSILSTPKCQMHDDGHQRLLPENPNEKTRVHAAQDYRHTARGHRSLQSDAVSYQ